MAKTICRICFVVLLGMLFLSLALPYAFLSEQVGARLPWLQQLVVTLKTAWPGVSLDHLVAFAALGAAFKVAMPRAGLGWSFCGLVALALGTELVQTFVPGREAHLGDAAMDIVGGGLGYLVAVAGQKGFASRKPA